MWESKITLNDYINYSTDDPKSIQILNNLSKSIIDKGHVINIEVCDKAKYSQEDNKMLIKVRAEYNFDTLLHEMLHGKIESLKFPKLIEIKEMCNMQNLQLCDGHFFNFTNDIHHHLFYSEFINLASQISNTPKFLSNESYFKNFSTTTLDFLVSRYRFEILPVFKFNLFYQAYISVKYAKLLYNKEIFPVKLRELDPYLYECHETAFNNILSCKLSSEGFYDTESIMNEFVKLGKAILVYFKPIP